MPLLLRRALPRHSSQNTATTIPRDSLLEVLWEPMAFSWKSGIFGSIDSALARASSHTQMELFSWSIARANRSAIEIGAGVELKARSTPDTRRVRWHCAQPARPDSGVVGLGGCAPPSLRRGWGDERSKGRFADRSVGNPTDSRQVDSPPPPQANHQPNIDHKVPRAQQTTA